MARDPHAPTTFLVRHRRVLIAVGCALGAAIGAGYKAIAATGEAAQPPAPLTSQDVSGLREDIGYLRQDIRDERRARERLSTQMGEFNGRLGKLEGASK